MLNLTGECIHLQTSQDNGISNTQLRIELAAWLMIDEQEIKNVKPTVAADCSHAYTALRCSKALTPQQALFSSRRKLRLESYQVKQASS